jgi:hypothetical protein
MIFDTRSQRLKIGAIKYWQHLFMLCIVRQSVNIGSSRVAGQSLSRLQQQGWRGNVKLMVSAKNGAIAITDGDRFAGVGVATPDIFGK